MMEEMEVSSGEDTRSLESWEDREGWESSSEEASEEEEEGGKGVEFEGLRGRPEGRPRWRPVVGRGLLARLGLRK